MTFAYRRKPIHVEAIQWGKRSDLPYWLFGALKIEANHLYGRVKPVRDGLQVDTGNGTRVAHVGDWIVFDKAKDRLQVVTDATFQDEFEPDERKARTRSTTHEQRRLDARIKRLRVLRLSDK